MKTAMDSEQYLFRSASGRLLCRQGELDHFPLLLRGKPLHALRELGRYVKLNYFCHGQSFKSSVLPLRSGLFNYTVSSALTRVNGTLVQTSGEMAAQQSSHDSKEFGAFCFCGRIRYYEVSRGSPIQVQRLSVDWTPNEITQRRRIAYHFS
jgi:hypothetical protein